MPIKIRRLRAQMSIKMWMNKQVWYMHTVIDFIWQPEITSSVVGQRSSSKALPQAKLAPMKGHGHWLMVYYPSDPLQFSESWQNHYIWEVYPENWWDALKTVTYSQHWSIERAQFFMTMLKHTSYNQCFKSWTNWATKFCLIHHIHLTSHQLTTTSSSILIAFSRDNFHKQQEAEYTFKGFIKSQNTDFYAIGINKLTSCWQKCVDCNGSYFD